MKAATSAVVTKDRGSRQGKFSGVATGHSPSQLLAYSILARGGIMFSTCLFVHLCVHSSVTKLLNLIV